MNSGAKHPLSDEQRWALHTAAAAGGFDVAFGDLLCELAETVGFEAMLNELDKVRAELANLDTIFPPGTDEPPER
ncbi:MAG TPA: hypothetical protein VGX68_13940 [Thermoanaerobaculia bacterium]|jgi:hypothetical protein|nr:hypothetical protein [Thermoanaerobaculia bacterium]